MNECVHIDFVAECDVSRLFNGIEITEADAYVQAPDSVAVDLRIKCKTCGKAVRFEGPIGVAVGPGAPLMVSMDGTELRANGHLGENRSPTIRARFSGGAL